MIICIIHVYSIFYINYSHLELLVPNHILLVLV